MNRMKQARNQARLTYQRAAEELHVSISSVQRWEEEGFRPEQLRLETLFQVCACYGVSLDWLVGDAISQFTVHTGR